MTARNFGVTPVQAWHELGYPALRTARQRGRVTSAASELWACEAAFTEITREKGEPTVEQVLLMVEIRELYAADIGVEI